jgi:hypothetical protein
MKIQIYGQWLNIDPRSYGSCGVAMVKKLENHVILRTAKGILHNRKFMDDVLVTATKSILGFWIKNECPPHFTRTIVSCDHGKVDPQIKALYPNAK